MLPQLSEHGVRDRDIPGHGIHVREQRALARGENARLAPVAQGLDFPCRHAGRGRVLRLMDLPDVIAAGQRRNPHDGELAHTIIETGLEAHRVVEVEPRGSEAWCVQQRAIENVQLAATGAADLRGERGDLGRGVFVDERDSRHGLHDAWGTQLA
ncbi:hypothetical protein D3C83_06290 [compost metagenome]